MTPINFNIVKIKNLIGIIETPQIEDLLFEIVFMLDQEKRYDGEFKTRDVSLKTRVRIAKSGELDDDLAELEKLGYIKKLKYSSYEVIKHLWV
jgi:hypothetical protein